jgi:hypothetical protein
VKCQAPAIDTSIPKFDFSKERELEFSLFRSSLPAAPHTALFLVLYLSPSKFIIMEGLRGLTKIMATTNDTVVETQFVRCVISLFAHRIHFNTYGVLCKCLPRSTGCRWLTSTELQFLQVCESPSPPRGPPSFSFWRAGISVTCAYIKQWADSNFIGF